MQPGGLSKRLKEPVDCRRPRVILLPEPQSKQRADCLELLSGANLSLVGSIPDLSKSPACGDFVCRLLGGKRAALDQLLRGPTMIQSLQTGNSSPSVSNGAKPDMLDSWKEIAAYLRREVRTVQLWEKHEGLPVHRHFHRRLGSVYGLRSEIDQWKERV